MPKTTLKSYMRSKGVRVVDKEGKDVNKEDLVTIFLDHSNVVLKSLNMKIEGTSTQYYFSEECFGRFIETGYSKTRNSLDVGNVYFWDLIST